MHPLVTIRIRSCMITLLFKRLPSLLWRRLRCYGGERLSGEAKKQEEFEKLYIDPEERTAGGKWRYARAFELSEFRDRFWLR